MGVVEAVMRGIANRGKPERVFDWHKAARIIRERKPHAAYAGLAEDLAETFSVIYVDGELLEDGSGYLASTWATPNCTLTAIPLSAGRGNTKRNGTPTRAGLSLRWGF